MMYFDNAATTFPKPKSVILGVNTCLKKIGGNPSRSSHKLSILASEEIYKTREAIAGLLNISDPESIVFTYNATYALNMAIKTMIRERCHIIVSDVEHNSVIRPLEALKETLGVEYSVYNSDMLPEIAIPPLIKNDTKFIVSTLCSNVSGKNIDFYSLSNVAKSYSLRLIVDASQAIGHTAIDLSKTPCDALCAPAHKALFGIQGCGFTYFANKYREGSFIEGGSGSNSVDLKMPNLLPEGYEAGTLSTVGIMALRCGIDFVTEIGIENIEYHLNKLRGLAEAGLSEIPGIILYPSFGGNIIFNMNDLKSSASASLLDELNICTRGGLHCAPLAHKKLGTLENGSVRVSFSIMNTQGEVERFVDIVKKISHRK